MDQPTRKLAEDVYQVIKDTILNGGYDSRDWLPIDEIAAREGVSRQPVMDAMKRLALGGFVSIVPQKGCRVRLYDSGQVQDFFRMFAEAEGLVAELAAQRASEDDIADMRLVSTRIGRLQQANLAPLELGQSYRRLNREFHLRMRAASGSPVVAEVVESLGDRSDFFVAQAGRPIFSSRVETAHREHEAMLDDIVRRDWRSAKRIMRGHILAIAKRLSSV